MKAVCTKNTNLEFLAERKDTSVTIMAVLGVAFHPMSVLET